MSTPYSFISLLTINLIQLPVTQVSVRNELSEFLYPKFVRFSHKKVALSEHFPAEWIGAIVRVTTALQLVSFPRNAENPMECKKCMFENLCA